MYKLKFSKLYRDDVDSSYNYIKNKLEAPMAANNLIIEIIEIWGIGKRDKMEVYRDVEKRIKKR